MSQSQVSGLRGHLPSTAFVLIVLLLLVALAGIFIYGGIYNIGADAPHSRFVYGALQELRERAIASYSRDVNPPADLNSQQRIAAGAGVYNEMCTGCHLGPGVERSELSQGLYPSAPELAQGDGLTPAEQFWVIKHGVKLTAMPAWGKTHDDQLIWDMVAFIRWLPRMNAAQYQAAVASAPESHEEMMEHMGGARHDTASEAHSHERGPAAPHH